MLKLFTASLLFLVTFASFVYADEAPAIVREYRAKNSRTICDIKDNLPGRYISILLSDGTLWDCFYLEMSDRQTVLTKWEIGQEAQISPIGFIDSSQKRSDAYRLASSSNQPASLVFLPAYLDVSTANVLPTLVGKPENGHLCLSNGSVWEETSFITVASLWKDGDRIFVADWGSGYKLINIDHGRGFFYREDYMPVNLISYKPLN